MDITEDVQTDDYHESLLLKLPYMQLRRDLRIGIGQRVQLLAARTRVPVELQQDRLMRLPGGRHGRVVSLSATDSSTVGAKSLIAWLRVIEAEATLIST